MKFLKEGKGVAINHQVTPHGGWSFLEPKTNIKIVSLTHERLVRDVSNHRRSNGIDVGNVEKDIDEQIENNHPYLSINANR